MAEKKIALKRRTQPSDAAGGEIFLYANSAGELETVDDQGGIISYAPGGGGATALQLNNGSDQGVDLDAQGQPIPLSGTETLGTNATPWPEAYVKHLNTGGAKPSVSAGSSATASGTAELSANSTDGSGTLTVTTGVDDPVAAGLIAAITFVSAFIDGPRSTFTPKNAAAADVKIYADTTANAVSLFNSSSSLLSASTTYIWDYTVTGPATANPGE